ncbi:NAD-dependent epimerase/dehydratase family protein [Cryptosporangium arvum]|uniref:Nucleoside-diphosphate-sugar epimerase n=1 Tax=Cryptosporangium arvum DSM 44712 TaxID=927661 RepID=A0A011AIV6_9ACTN|nr:NAD(P)-dependent oxidoreductase [Cryptosporangium arvum]EXG81951.1 nucleoside-diphosphate-sugar epimerase [Cryptosporangium arvum DSM 44712]
MRIFLAGGTGVLGRRIVPALLEGGHDVTVLARTPGAVVGAHAVRGDVLDAEATRLAVAEAAPDLVMHQLTDLAGGSGAANAALRVAGTRNLVDATRAAGVGRLIVQSIAWCYEPGATPASEDTPLDTGPAPDGIPAGTGPARRITVDAVAAMEATAREVTHAVVLRNGLFYGPGTWYWPDGSQAARARAGDLPATADVTSFVHVDDAAAAAVAALDWPPGAVNVVDDEPADGYRWTPVFCAAVGAPPPPRADAPRQGWARGATNAKARALGWSPRRTSWRDGFRPAVSG